MTEQSRQELAAGIPDHGGLLRTRTVAAYGLFASLWILGSDSVLDLLMQDREALVRIGTYKGWLFVVIISALLYWLMRPETPPPAGHPEPQGSIRPWLAPFAVSMILIAVLTGAVLVSAYRDHRDAVWLPAVGVLAAFACAAWMFLQRERLALQLKRAEARQHAEKQQALRLLQSIANGSTDAIYAKDKAGRFLLLNREASRVLGKPAEAVIGKEDDAIFSDLCAEGPEAVDRRVMETRQPITFEHEVDTVDGTLTYLTTRGPLCDPDGQVTGVFGVSRDITERRRTELALRESAALVQAAGNSILDHMAVLSAAGNVIAVNAAWRALAADPTCPGRDILPRCDVGIEAPRSGSPAGLG